MAREDISREIGEIKVCLTFIREALASGSKNFEELFNRVSAIENKVAVIEAWEHKHDDDSQSKINFWLAFIAIGISITAILIDLFIKGG